MDKKMTELKLQLLEMLNTEYELLESNPTGEDRLCIYSRIKIIAEILNKTYYEKKD